MSSALKLANSPVLWFLSFLLVSVVIVQTLIFFKLAKEYVSDTNILTEEEVKKSIRIGISGSLGPAIAVFAVAIALIASVGAPITLSRIGVIGSATFELLASKIGSNGTVGTPEFSETFLSTTSWVMSIGGAGWLISSLFMTKKLNSFQDKAQSMNKLIIPYIATFAPFVIFLSLSVDETQKSFKKGSSATLIAIITGAIIMFLLNKLSSSNKKYNWLKEWAMGFSVIGAMFIGSLLK